MKKLPKCLIVLVLVFGGLGSLTAQESASSGKNRSIELFTELGYTAGGQINRDNFVYRSGLAPSFGLQKAIHKKVAIGLSASLLYLHDERFIPISLQIILSPSGKKNGNKLFFRTGFATGSAVSSNNFVLKSFSGGVYFSSGYLYRFDLSDSKGMGVKIGITHQQARMNIVGSDGTGFKSQLYYAFLETGLSLFF